MYSKWTEKKYNILINKIIIQLRVCCFPSILKQYIFFSSWTLLKELKDLKQKLLFTDSLHPYCSS